MADCKWNWSLSMSAMEKLHPHGITFSWNARPECHCNLQSHSNEVITAYGTSFAAVHRTASNRITGLAVVAGSACHTHSVDSLTPAADASPSSSGAAKPKRLISVFSYKRSSSWRRRAALYNVRRVEQPLRHRGGEDRRDARATRCALLRRGLATWR